MASCRNNKDTWFLIPISFGQWAKGIEEEGKVKCERQSQEDVVG